MEKINLAGRKILVVEDEEALRDILVSHLTRLGATVFSAANGEQANQRLAAQPVDLIISDIRMPGGDGAELLKSVRGRSPALPIFVLMTGYSEFTVEEAKACGANEVLSKPFQMKDLDAKVAHLLEIVK